MTSDITRLLAHLHRGGASAHWWTNPGKQSHWWPVGDPSPIPSGEHNTYFPVHPSVWRKGPHERAKIEDVAAINCLLADLDAKDLDGSKDAALAHIESLDTAPSMVIDSVGGHQCYWLLAEPYAVTTEEKRKRARAIQHRWVRHTGGDPDAKDLARVLRVPGTQNLKYPDRSNATVVHAEFHLLYSLDELEAQLPPKRPQAPPGGNGPVVKTPDRGGPMRPLEASWRR